MDNIVLLGIDKECGDIVKEALKYFDGNKDYHVTDIVIDDENLHGTVFEQNYIVKSYDDILDIDFDKICVCAPKSLTKKVEKIVVDTFGLASDKCFSYLQPRVGDRYIEMNADDKDIDMYNKVMTAANLNDFEQFFYNNKHRAMRKWLHYLEVYDKHLSKYKNQSPVIIEVGVYKGGSMQMWKNYFGEGTTVIGIDINEETKQYEEDGIIIEIGSQDDRDFWKYIRKKYPKVDILVDDGGHRMEQQIITFEEMFPHLSFGGCFICEDMHTSYWERFGGKYKDESTFVEYSKNLIDYINAWHSETEALAENSYTRTIFSVCYYTSMLVIEKKRTGYPVELFVGD